MNHNLQLCFLTICAVIASSFGGENRAFGNCTTNGTRFSYAPEYLGSVHCSRLTTNDYARANWWPVTDIAPIDVPTNMVAHAYGWRKDAHDNTREEIEWVTTVPPQTNEWGEVIYVPVTNTVHFTTYTITRLYNVIIRPIPEPVPRRFSKLKIYGAIASIGAWEKVETWLKSKSIGGVNGWMAFQLAQEISEDHPMFAPLAAEAKALLGLTDAQFEALLNSCILED